MKRKKISIIGALVLGLVMSGCGSVATRLEPNRLNAVETVTGTINFGSAAGSTNVNSASKTGDDSLGNTWTITTTGTTSFTPNASYSQIGSSNKPASTISFTTTLSEEQTIKSFSAKFGGFNGTAGSIELLVGTTSVGSGSLNAGSDVTVSKTGDDVAGTVLTINVSSIAKGVKAYYISYSYDVTVDNPVTKYNVTFKSESGETLATEVVNEGSLIQNAPTATKDSDTQNQIRYSFTSWCTVSDPENPDIENGTDFDLETPITSDLVLFPKFAAIPYHIVSFNTDGGSNVESKQVDHGTRLTKATTPTKDGFRFDGWYYENGTPFNFEDNSITEDLTLYAHWASIDIVQNGFFVKVTSVQDLVDDAMYLIVYEDGDRAFNGSLGVLDATSNFVDVEFTSGRIKKDDNTKNAYFTISTDDGYIQSASSKYIGVTSYSNALATAQNPGANYVNDIAFDENGNVLITRTIEEGKVMTLSYNDGAGQNRFRYFKNAIQSVQLYKFEEAYTISFETYGGTSIDNMYALDGDVISLPSNPTKAADASNTYEFVGWYTDSEFKNSFDATQPIHSNLTLHAKFNATPIDSPQTYVDNGSAISTLHGTENYNIVDSAENIVFADEGYNNEQLFTSATIGDVEVTADGAGENNVPKYFNTGSGVRFYKNNTISFACATNISRIEFVFASNYATGLALTTESGDFDGSVWEGSAKNLTFKYSNSTGHVRIQSIEVTYGKRSFASVSNVAIRFGARISRSNWEGLNSKGAITDYGVMLLRETTLNSYVGSNTVEQAFRNNRPVTIKNKCANDTPFANPYLDENTDSYEFTYKINMTSEDNYDITFCAAPFVVAGGQYYFFEETSGSVKSLATYYSTHDGCNLSSDALTYLKSVQTNQ